MITIDPGRTYFLMTGMTSFASSDGRAKTIVRRAGASFSFSDLLRRAGPGHGATQRYLKQLVVDEVLIVDNERPQPRYGANTAHPLYAELRALLAKTAGAE